MREELEQQLADRFPFMQGRNVFTDEPTGYPMPCECSDGWFKLLWDLCEELERYYIENNFPVDDIRMVQIKEKYGELRFYTSSMYGDAFDIIEKYELLSYQFCEVCGEEGRLKHKHRWFRTLCDKCGDPEQWKDYDGYGGEA